MQSFVSLQSPSLFLAAALCSLIAAFVVLSPARPTGNERAAMLRFGSGFALWSISMGTLWLGHTHQADSITTIASLTAMGQAAFIVHGSIKLFGGRLPVSITLGALALAMLGHLVAAGDGAAGTVVLIETSVMTIFAGITAFLAWRARDTAGIDYRRGFALGWTLTCLLLTLKMLESIAPGPAGSLYDPAVGGVIDGALSLSLMILPVLTALMVRGVLGARTAERVRRFSQHDEVTGLLNRTAMAASAQGVLSRTRLSDRSAAVIMIEFDDMKIFRNRLGQRGTDRLMRNIAGSMRRALRADSILARYDTDSLCAIVPVRSESEARIVANRLLEVVIGQEVMVDATPTHPAASLGFSIRQAEETLDELVLAAVRRAAEARSLGADRIAPDPQAGTTATDEDHTRRNRDLALSQREC
jgi:diguanylate cyclase (GGDEF)-like protein